MQKQYFVQNNGQEVQQSDLNLLGENGALADDRTLQGLLRLFPYAGGNVTKAVLPVDFSPNAIVTPGAGFGGVYAAPFLAIIGSRSDSAGDALKNYQDIRSAWCMGAAPFGAGQQVIFASNASGNPRWDLVLAQVIIDPTETAVQRFVKDPVSLQPAPQTLPVTKKTFVSINVTAGTPAASPTKPAAPADSGSTYYIPLAYVRIPNGFNGTSTTSVNDVEECGPVVTLAQATGVSGILPANNCFKPTGAMLATRDPWAAAGNRPRAYLPPTMTGGVQKFIPLQFTDSPNNAANGDVIDDSIDWRNRLFRWQACVGSGIRFAWDPTLATTPCPSTLQGGTLSHQQGMGQSFVQETVSGQAPVAQINGTSQSPVQHRTDQVPANTVVQLYVDLADGKLKLSLSGSAPAACVLFWIDATGAFVNH